MLRRPHIAFALALTACWGPAGNLSHTYEVEEDNETWQPNTDTGPEDTGSDTSDNRSHPFIDSADAWCYTTSDSGDWWGMKVGGDDPQGTATLLAFIEDGCKMFDGGGAEVAALALVCEDSGECWGSAQADHIDIQCSSPSSYTVAFWLEDADGHRSAKTEVEARWGSGPNG